jgi:phenylacetate-CoA oxygenase PaaJ subunit
MIAPGTDRILQALRDVEDPELPISIVDMGLVVAIRPNGDEVEVDITLTAMGCPAVEMITDDIERRLLREPGIEHVQVNIVWEPIWTKDRMSEEGKAQLREWGISV